MIKKLKVYMKRLSAMKLQSFNECRNVRNIYDEKSKQYVMSFSCMKALNFCWEISSAASILSIFFNI